ncbi:hypothetical protein L202_03913 [Cryptococcus amylolentus CBS 6039]|uniref:Uncharacterized protein n=1 Tax=Cryptococcus amylolentus CBS 6039 TaxID=1295533 RepID=A0A1E3HRE8_9TREE|nr:hypothetical protein L202_03913 [Cryptococcus amylolentus CBS 6039]ODN78266.1 hypothetical protein L202_03913 [Cryptococcus amylolentus CBS 6039]
MSDTPSAGSERNGDNQLTAYGDTQESRNSQRRAFFREGFDRRSRMEYKFDSEVDRLRWVEEATEGAVREMEDEDHQWEEEDRLAAQEDEVLVIEQDVGMSDNNNELTEGPESQEARTEELRAEISMRFDEGSRKLHWENEKDRLSWIRRQTEEVMPIIEEKDRQRREG